MKVIVISVGLHVIVGFIAGIIKVATIVAQQEAQFEVPPAVVEEELPVPVNMAIQLQKPIPPQIQNLSTNKVGEIRVSKISVVLPNMEQNFTVSAGLGNVNGGGGLGNVNGGSGLLGGLLGGIRESISMGMSDVSVFGLKTRAERILFVIDTHAQMVSDKKGGLNSYQVIKDEITDMVGNLSAGTLFNVLLHDRSKTVFFKPKLISAGADVHQELIQWISPINASAENIGLQANRLARKNPLKTLKEEEVHLALERGLLPGNETGFITQTVLEQNVDSIFLITGFHRGFEDMFRDLNKLEEAEWQRKIASPNYQKKLAAHYKEIPQMKVRIQATLAKINEKRKANGQPPQILEERWIYGDVETLNLKWMTPHPGHKPSIKIPERDVIAYFRKLVGQLYTIHEKEVPSINVLLFLAKDEELPKELKHELETYVKFFRGKDRIIRGEEEIQNARSSKNVKN